MRLSAELLTVLGVLLPTTHGQFNGFGSRFCDINQLHRAMRGLGVCMKEALDMERQAEDEKERYDPACSAGFGDAIRKCSGPLENILAGQDLEGGAIVECCFPGRTSAPAFPRRNCEFTSKPFPADEDKQVKLPTEQVEKTKMTLAGRIHQIYSRNMEGTLKILGLCPDKDLSINAVSGPYRDYKDRLIAKTWSCFSPLMEVASNCTELAFRDVECLMKGLAWAENLNHACILSCHRDSLAFLCRMFESQPTVTPRIGNLIFNNGGGNRNSNFNNINNPWYSDPFGRPSKK